MGNTSRPGENSANDKARLRAGLAGVAEQKALIARAQAQLIRHHATVAEVALEQHGRMGSQSPSQRAMPKQSIARGGVLPTPLSHLTAPTAVNHTLVRVTR